MKGSIAILVFGIISVVVLVAVLKVAVRLAVIALAVVVAIAAWNALKERIGGPRA